MTAPAGTSPTQAAGTPAQAGRQRIDRWLWCARFFKTRSLATREVSAGHVRVNGGRVTKPAALLKPGDTLTFQQGDAIRVVSVVALSERRGPASEAQGLYEDRSPAPAPRGERPPGANPRPDAAPDTRARARLRALKHTS